MGVALCGSIMLLAGATAAAAVELIALQPVPGNTDVLSIETQPFSSALLGSAGFLGVSGLDRQPGSGLLFASSGGGDGGRLFTLDPATGQASLVGDATPFARLPGLAFDLDGTLFASAGGDQAGVLITLDPDTAFGTLVGSFATDGFVFIDALAVHPLSGQLFGIGLVCDNADCLEDFSSHLFTIDKATGLATSLGALVDAQTAAPLACCPAGLAFDAAANLFASTGFTADPASAGRILSIDPGLSAYTVLGDTGSFSVSDIVVPEPSRLWLGLAALGAIGTLRRLANPQRTSQAANLGSAMTRRVTRDWRWLRLREGNAAGCGRSPHPDDESGPSFSGKVCKRRRRAQRGAAEPSVVPAGSARRRAHH